MFGALCDARYKVFTGACLLVCDARYKLCVWVFVAVCDARYKVFTGAYLLVCDARYKLCVWMFGALCDARYKVSHTNCWGRITFRPHTPKADTRSDTQRNSAVSTWGVVDIYRGNTTRSADCRDSFWPGLSKILGGHDWKKVC
ncbi:hypothetical protein RRG08_000204 [Elysia crispata]|uniref:Uncharacterized protein n=1 Tax=Elysia crispata TaxID=231223 RepID=A0AAE1D538_9GAST|nr:hypothetical protein RRG08_000204 [Elysia crispata]